MHRLVTFCLAGLGLVVSAACGSSGSNGGGVSGGAGTNASGGGGGSGGATGGSGGATGGSGGATGGSGGATGGTAGTGATAGTGGAGATGGGAGAGGTGGGGNHIKTVFLILMENESWCSIQGNADASYINQTLLTTGAWAKNYKGAKNGALHPSEPNYIWLEAGDNLGVTNDNDPSSNHQSTTDHLVTYMKGAGVTWRSYQEDISGTTCPLTSVNNYAPKHNPNVFFDDVTGNLDPNNQYCIQHNRPLTELTTDLQNNTTAQFNFITPNLCDDMHNSCAPLNNNMKQGDQWLSTWIPRITGSAVYKSGGAIFITWDESEIAGCCPLANCPIGMIVLSPFIKSAGYSNSIAYDHSSTLKSIQEIFGLTPLLRAAGNSSTNDLSGLFSVFP
jgi:phosphatidylinositol-3-phosphatase